MLRRHEAALRRYQALRRALAAARPVTRLMQDEAERADATVREALAAWAASRDPGDLWALELVVADAAADLRRLTAGLRRELAAARRQDSPPPTPPRRVTCMHARPPVARRRVPHPRRRPGCRRRARAATAADDGPLPHLASAQVRPRKRGGHR